MDPIEERWQTRVVPNGWDKNSCIGSSKAYMHKYGRGMKVDKLLALQNKAYQKGATTFANGIKDFVPEILKRSGVSKTDRVGWERYLSMFNYTKKEVELDRKGMTKKELEQIRKGLSRFSSDSVSM